MIALLADAKTSLKIQGDKKKWSVMHLKRDAVATERVRLHYTLCDMFIRGASVFLHHLPDSNELFHNFLNRYRNLHAPMHAHTATHSRPPHRTHAHTHANVLTHTEVHLYRLMLSWDCL